MGNSSVPAKEKLLACVSASASSGQLIGSVKRMAMSSWLDRLSIGVMVYNMLKLPGIF